MSSQDRKPYLTATALDQDTLDACHDNLVNQLEMICEIEAPDVPGATEGGVIYASDRNKYVGAQFYEALLKFPTIKRTIGEWLNNSLEFSSIRLELSNADGRFNHVIPGGDDFSGWTGRAVTVKLGLAEDASTYRTIFQGRITDEGGFGRTTKSLILTARDDFEKLKAKFPTEVFSATEFPDIEDGLAGQLKPIIYGDWTVGPFSEIGAAIPAHVVNGQEAGITDGTVSVHLAIAGNDLEAFQNSTVTLVRSQQAYTFDVGDVHSIGAGNRTFKLWQDLTSTPGTTQIDDGNGGGPIAYRYRRGDKFYVHVKGKDLGGFDDNIVSQARDVLLTYGGAVVGDLHSNWTTYRDKSSPAQDDISTAKSRIHLTESQEAIKYVRSLLAQVRLELHIDNDQKLKIRSMHFSDFTAEPTYTVRNFDVERGSFNPHYDTRNNFNRAQGFYNYLPDKKDNYGKTNFFENDDAADQDGAVEKGLVFPNLYDSAFVGLQVIEILKMASATFEYVDCTLTWRSMLLDLGDFVGLDVQIGSSQFVRVPAMVRELSYDANGPKMPMVFMSFQMMPFGAYSPPHADNCVGGEDADIIEET